MSRLVIRNYVHATRSRAWDVERGYVGHAPRSRAKDAEHSYKGFSLEERNNGYIEVFFPGGSSRRLGSFGSMSEAKRKVDEHLASKSSDSTHDIGKPGEEAAWRREVEKLFPSGEWSGDSRFVGTKLVAEWRGSREKSFVSKPKSEDAERSRARDAKLLTTRVEAKNTPSISYATGVNEGWVVNLMGLKGGPFKTRLEAEDFYIKHRYRDSIAELVDRVRGGIRESTGDGHLDRTIAALKKELQQLKNDAKKAPMLRNEKREAEIRADIADLERKNKNTGDATPVGRYAQFFAIIKQDSGKFIALGPGGKQYGGEFGSKELVKAHIDSLFKPGAELSNLDPVKGKYR